MIHVTGFTNTCLKTPTMGRVKHGFKSRSFLRVLGSVSYLMESPEICGLHWNWFSISKKKWKCTDFIFSCSNYLSKNGDLGDVILLFYLHYSFCGTPNWSTWFAVTFYNTYQTTVKGFEKIDTTNGSRFPNSRQWNIHRHLHNCMFVRVDDAGNF